MIVKTKYSWYEKYAIELISSPNKNYSKNSNEVLTVANQKWKANYFEKGINANNFLHSLTFGME